MRNVSSCFRQLQSLQKGNVTRFGTSLSSRSPHRAPKIYSAPRDEGKEWNRFSSEILWRKESTKTDDELYKQYESAEICREAEKTLIKSAEKPIASMSNTNEDPILKYSRQDDEELNEAEQEEDSIFLEAVKLSEKHATMIHPASSEGDGCTNQEEKKMKVISKDKEVGATQQVAIHNCESTMNDREQNVFEKGTTRDKESRVSSDDVSKHRSEKRYESSNIDLNKTPVNEGKRKYDNDLESSRVHTSYNSYTKPSHQRKDRGRESPKSSTIYSQSTSSLHQSNSSSRGTRDLSSGKELSKSSSSAISQEPYKKYKKTLYRQPKYPLDELK
jgi:hypothetical protein